MIFKSSLKLKQFILMPFIICFCITINFQLLSSNCNAQDAHFSQYYNSPLSLNPSLAGAFDGDLRVLTSYRDQWQSVTNPFKTFALSGDMGFFKKTSTTGFLGIGLSVMSDKAGTSQLGSNQVNLSVAYHVYLSEHQTLSAGIQSGFAQESMNFNNVNWGNQYNGTDGFDPNLPSYEPAHSNTHSYFDFAGGLQWTYTKGEMYAIANNQLNVNLGMSIYHVNQPNISFYTDYKDKLPLKFVFHGNSMIGLLNSNLSIVPSFLYEQQSTSKDIVAGALIRIKLQDESRYTGFIKGAALSVGSYYRLGDAIIPTIQLEMGSYAMGLSYDVNTSALSNATSGRGGFEISLRYFNPNPFTGRIAIKSPRFFN